KQNIEEVEGLSAQFADPKDPETLAEFQGAKLTWKEFQAANIQYPKMYQKLFNQRMQRLNGIVVRRYLLEASKAAQIPMEDFVRKEILPQALQPSVEDVKAFAKEKNISESDLNESMIERLKDIVSQNDRDEKIEKYVAENLVKEPIKVSFQEPRFFVKAPDFNDSMPQWGATQGPKLVFIGHWSCDNCGDSLAVFLAAKRQWIKTLNGAFIYSFPIRDREARMGAEASLCVKDQDKEAFWTFLENMMGGGEGTLEKRLDQAAQNAGVDFDKYRQCFLKREFADQVEQHLQLANSLGVISLPVTLFQNELLVGTLSDQRLSQEVAKLGLNKKEKKGFIGRILAFFGLS
ncbi:MAG: thioredoxin domain-containing protein, partial [Pseudomonadota bacterium]